MNIIEEDDAKIICERFFEIHQWERIQLINHSKIGLNPLIILNKEGDVPTVHLFDNYRSVVEHIKSSIENDLIKNGGYSESFYLSYEDIDNLGLQKYVQRVKDAEKIIDLANSNLNNY